VLRGGAGIAGAVSPTRAPACIDVRDETRWRAPAEKSHRESAAAIRAKNRFWRATMRREAGCRENFFIAKNGDSESAQRAFSGIGESR
jgi:hypothetical protein